MIDCLTYGNKIVLLAVTVKDGCLEAALGFFDKGLTENSVVVSNGVQSFNVELPQAALQLEGRAKKYRVKLELI